MSSRKGPSPYHAIASLRVQPGTLQTQLFFQPTKSHGLSPLDDFIGNVDQLNKLASSHSAFPNDFSPLLLLGYMSAVESYARRLVVSVIQLDEVARRKSASKNLLYGATLCAAGAEEYADALLEGVSFAGRKGIQDTFKEFLGLNVGGSLDDRLRDYQEICELRHCCVHRFGRLGAKNAVALGIDAHAKQLGHEFRTDLTGFEDIASRLRNFVKGLNNTAWEELMHRTALNKGDNGSKLYPVDWSWNWRSDQKRFTSYWRIFATTKDSIPSSRPFQMYETFRNHHRK